MFRNLVLLILMGAGLWLGTGLVRSAAIPGLSSLEKQIEKDWEILKEKHTELDNVGELIVSGSDEGGLSEVWATEIGLSCYAKKDGIYGAEILLVPVDLEEGPAATVQIYLYDLKSGHFVKEFSRLYHL